MGRTHPYYRLFLRHKFESYNFILIDCQNAGHFNSITRFSGRRLRRGIEEEFSFKEDREDFMNGLTDTSSMSHSVFDFDNSTLQKKPIYEKQFKNK